jgi:AcrR family transcriptional regulator
MTAVNYDPDHLFTDQVSFAMAPAPPKLQPSQPDPPDLDPPTSHTRNPGSPTPGRRERKKLETRNRIFSEAIGLFIEKGFDATTVEEIAERADVGKGTVFNYFPQKTAFLIAAYSEWVRVMQEQLGPVESWAGSIRYQLVRVFDFLIDLSVRHRALSRQIIFENMRQNHLRMAQWEAEGAGGPQGVGSPESPEGTAEADAPNRAAKSGAKPGGEPGNEDPEPEALRLLETMVREVVRKGKAGAEIRPEIDESRAASLIAAAAFHTMVRGLVRNTPAPEIKHALAEKIDIIFTGLNP